MTDPILDLLRRLASRIDDETLNSLHGYLFVGEETMMGDVLVGYLVEHRVPLTDEERTVLLSAAEVEPHENEAIPRTTVIPRNYVFDSGAHVPEPTETDARIVEYSTHLPGARTLSRAYRRPAHAAAPGPATWLYLVEFAPDAMLHPASNLPTGGPAHGVAEVYWSGEQLPEYHVEALRVARVVWARDA
ncbi:hypothetical protein [Nocardia sp. CA-290969]|uniref:hypothetical protein n=1 Tax=Nocardia sp. CA-290969 TaxID=3239986 RepID=UPI003D8E2FF7